MGVGIDGDFDSLLFGEDAVTPVQIQPVGVGVQFQGLAELGRCVEHLLDVDGVGLTGQEEPPRGMGQDGGERMLQGRDDAARHFLGGQVEPGMDGGDDEIEQRQRVVVIIQRSVGQDIRFDPFEDVKRRVLCVDLVDGGVLLLDIFDFEASGVVGRTAMIADA